MFFRRPIFAGRHVIAAVAIAWTSVLPAFCQQTGSITGTVTDPAKAVIRGAQVVAVNAAGVERKTTTNGEGSFFLGPLAPGKYRLQVSSPGFAPFRRDDLIVAASRPTPLEISLEVTILENNVVNAEDRSINTDPESSAGATTLKGTDIETLPDDPSELEAALQALAGPGAGPAGGEIFVDGFSGARMPPRDTIREIRINQNPFSSEFDRLGLGRIEIFTKPGTEQWNGEADMEFEDEALNSRNPFAVNRPPYQLRGFGLDLSGPLIKKRASFYVDAEHGRTDNNALINALLLDASLAAIPFRQAVVVPSSDVEFSPRFDLALSEDHTLVLRYGYERSRVDNSGLGGFDLPSRAFSSRDTEHLFRLNDTLVISPRVINETRFQYLRRRNSELGDEGDPVIRVLDAFTAGGPGVGRAFVDEDRVEFQNYSSVIRERHAVKFGIRLRNVSITDSSPRNFAGTFTFTSLDQYRDTIRNLTGAFPTQFTIAAGNPLASVKRTDAGVFVQNDWRIMPELTLSFGLRYENQTNISSNANIAPRFGFAFAPGAGGNTPPKTVFRGGFGIFYERFGEGLTLQSRRFDGVNQQQFVVTDAAILDAIVFSSNGVSNVPSASELTAFAQRQTTRLVAPGLESPYTIQSVFGVERQLPLKTTVSVTFVNAITRRMLRSRNLNSPINGVRADPAAGNIFQYESTGRLTQNQLIANFRSNFREGFSIFGNYSFGKTRSDTDGAGSLPINSFNLSNEYGDASIDVRHRFTVGGSFEAPWGLRINPFVTFRTGVPFNITTGDDNNLDSTFNDRPAFAQNASEPGVITTGFGSFDPTPDPGDVIIPRNFGRGPSFFNVNLRLSKEIGFGGGSRGGGDDDEDDDEAPYSVEFSAQIRNLFNHTNGGTPVGNLRSPFFGRPVALAGGGGGGGSSAGNRRVRLEITVTF